MTQDDFRALVRSAIKRGNAIPVDPYIRRAIRFIEMNYTLMYMRGVSPFSIVKGAASFSYASWGTIKSIDAIRAFFADGTFKDINKIEFPNIDRLSTYQGEFPSQFYLDAPTTTIYLNGTATETVSAIAQRSVVSLMSDEHWLFNFGEGATLGAALIEAGVDLKAPDLIQFGQAQFDRWIKVLLNADYDQRYNGQDIRL